MNPSTESRYACPTCKSMTVQPKRTADAGTVYCVLVNNHKDRRNRIMKKTTEGITGG